MACMIKLILLAFVPATIMMVLGLCKAAAADGGYDESDA